MKKNNINKELIITLLLTAGYFIITTTCSSWSYTSGGHNAAHTHGTTWVTSWASGTDTVYHQHGQWTYNGNGSHNHTIGTASPSDVNKPRHSYLVQRFIIKAIDHD